MIKLTPPRLNEYLQVIRQEPSVHKLLGIELLASLAATAGARPREKTDLDPNRTVCRSEEVVGSRLQTKKTCMTAIQWDQLEQQQRRAIERIQAFKPNSG